MRGLIFIIIGSLLMTALCYAQVDTLQLVEIGSIEAPSEIIELYIEDLDGDSLKEIILTTASNVHIYNGITYEPIWTSPELDHPRDLLFADINLDGFIDFSVKDTTNIHLFDSHNDAVIWTSPEIDSTYKCYTIGDRNDDDWVDVAILCRLQTPDSIIYDTVRITINDGPIFQTTNNMEIPILHYTRYVGDEYQRFRQDIINLIIVGLTGQGGQRGKLLMFTSFYLYRNHPQHPNGFWSSRTYSGHLYNIDPLNLQYDIYEDIGESTVYKIEWDSDNRNLYVLTERYYDYGDDYGAYVEYKKRIIEISADSIISDSVLWFQTYNDWGGYITGELNELFSGEEISFLSNDSIYLYDYSTVDYIWSYEDFDNIDELVSIYNATDIFDSPQIVGKTIDPIPVYKFISGSDGLLSAVLPDPEFCFSDISDPNSDGNDEIFSLDNDMLYIYGLQRTAIDDNIPTPGLPYLSANYPNPFNSSTTIEYSLPEAGEVTVEIFDLLGRRVETLIDEKQDAGAYRVTWDAEDRSSGVYFYKIASGEFSDTRRMVLLK